jgi:NhaB family Na+:H+ antiporter
VPSHTDSLAAALARNFLGNSPGWYKATIVAFLALNPLLLAVAGPVVTGWVLLAQFIYTLALSLRCYPLQPGGLLALEALALGLVTPEEVYQEVVGGFPVILLLIFMVAGIYFLKDLLLFVFSRLLLRVRSEVVLAFLFCAAGALLSAFLDALTVIAVVITVAVGFHGVYHRYASAEIGRTEALGVPELDAEVRAEHREDLEKFRGFLRGLLMHAAVGTMLGGVTTLVGEPQNLLVGKQAGWDFVEFFIRMAPVTMPVLAVGLLTCVVVQRLRWFGYGTPLPEDVRAVLQRYADDESHGATAQHRAKLLVQGVVAVLLLVGLALHVAEVGILGLMVIVLATAFTGIVDEQRLGKAFEAALPFTALLVVFFVIVGEIHHQHLFDPVVHWVLQLDGRLQAAAFYLANGVLSSISDNVFVASIYIGEIQKAFAAGLIDREQFDALAVAVNTGTNIPSIATPNGQAAFLFLLTSAAAPLVRLSYGRMCWMALPYLVTTTTTGLAAIWWWL